MAITRHTELDVYNRAVAVECKYCDREAAAKFYIEYHEIISMLVGMIRKPSNWTIE